MQTYCLHVQGSTGTTLDRRHQLAMAPARFRVIAPSHPVLAGQRWHKHISLTSNSPDTARHVSRSRRFVVSAQAGSSSRQRNIQQIPIFPLGMVALPGAVTPLNIFEARLQQC